MLQYVQPKTGLGHGQMLCKIGPLAVLLMLVLRDGRIAVVRSGNAPDDDVTRLNRLL